MFIDIEVTSGKILALLEDKGRLNFYEIKRIINVRGELIAQCLEWLIRAGYITEDAITREYVINTLQQVSL